MHRKLWPYLLLILILACKKDKATGSKSMMRFTVNGELVNCNGGIGINNVITANYGATVRGFHDKGYLEIIFIPTYPDSIKTGTYDLQWISESIKITYAEGTKQWVTESLTPNGTGTVTIENGSRWHLKGKFNIITAKGSDGSAEKTITAGEFDVYR